MTTVLDPSGTDSAAQQGTSLAPRLSRLDNVELGYLDNMKPGGRVLLEALHEDAVKRFGVRASFWEKGGPKSSAGPIEFAQSMADRTGAVLNALGD